MINRKGGVITTEELESRVCTVITTEELEKGV